MLGRKRRVSPVVRALRSPVARLVAGSIVVAGSAVATQVACARDAEEAAQERKQRYRLEPGETPKQGISRVARGELDLTIGLLEAAPNGDDGAEAIHEARKAIKRLRALLRVSRPALEDARYRRENVVLRDAGRELSEARDAQVMVETLDSLLNRFGDELPPGTGIRLRQELVASAERAQAAGPGSYEGVLDVLSRARERVSSWPLRQQDGRASLAQGFEKIYKKGRRARRHAEAEPTAENLHELRKRAKDLWHASQLLEPACPDKFKRMAKEAHRLSDLLGDDHDLCVLLDYASGHQDLLRRGELELLQSMVELRSQSLRSQAFDCAAELYRREPGRMVETLALV